MVDDSCQRLVQLALDGYERGLYTLLEAGHQLLDCVDIANAHYVLRNLPQELLWLLRDEADSAPHSEDEWGKLKLHHIGGVLCVPGYEPEPMTEEEQRRCDEENKKGYRKKIETIRDYFAHSHGKADP